MVIFPNCKINLGLRVLRKRTDGYHDLETIFYPIGLKDALEVVEENEPVSPGNIQFSQSGLAIHGPASSNLCIKAYELLKKDFPHLPSVKMHLHKSIPMGAGLGGGSADGAFTLRLLNEKFQLNISGSQLIAYALELGSDCPFFIWNKPCIATGRGELMEAIELNLSAFSFILVNPGIHINTGWAFSHIVPSADHQSLRTLISQPVQNWKNQLSNDFEPPVFKAYPAIEQIRNNMYELGALYASMTGTGSTVYGIFPKNKIPADFPLEAGYRLDRIA